MADSDNDSGGQVGGGGGELSSTKEQDRLLPIANVSRIMKRALPANAKVSKDAKETVQECVSEFISFVTGEASDKCQREKRKTVNGDDLLWAMATLGFDAYVEPLRGYLHRFREAEGDKGGAAAASSSSSSQSLQQMDGAGGMAVAGHLPAYGGAGPYEYHGMGRGGIGGGDGGSSGSFGGGGSAGIGFGGQR